MSEKKGPRKPFCTKDEYALVMRTKVELLFGLVMKMIYLLFQYKALIQRILISIVFIT